MECLPQNIAYIRPSTKCGQKTHTEDYQIFIKVRTYNFSEASIKYNQGHTPEQNQEQ